ncbi:MFS transporter [Nocardiopsis sp. HNM0947]|uniref:MFS transporter n=1 Tax=Nocardiopsis coralli TaxID=2772213 RepID=A0ABR9P2K9_9ACTN|nr:MFS transporter [Nocardiopsis coralli]
MLTVPLLMAATDMTVLFLALPAIAADLAPGSTQMLWILHVAEFLGVGMALTMGWLGARTGRRRLLLMGVALYGTASLGAAFAPTPEVLIAFRALMGVAAATLTPSIMALLRVLFRSSAQFSVAVAVTMSAFSAGMALGPPLGGVILEYFWWGAVFVLNVPVAVLVLIVAPFLLPSRREEVTGGFDLSSVVLSTSAIILVIFGLQEIADRTAAAAGAPLWPYVVSVAAGVGLGALFARRQLRLEDPLLDLSLFRRPAFSVSVAAVMFMLLAIGGADMLLAQFLQTVQALSPAQAGALLIVPAVAGLITGLLPPLLVRWVRPSIVMAGGLFTAAIGAAVMVWALPTGNTALIIATTTVIAAALGPLFTLSINLVVASAPVSKAGSATAVGDVGGGLGNALSLAFLGSLSAVVYRTTLQGSELSEVPGGAREAAEESIGGAAAVAESLPGAAAAELTRAADAAFTTAVQSGYGIAAVILVPTAVVVLWLLRHVTLDDTDGTGDTGGTEGSGGAGDTGGTDAAEVADSPGGTRTGADAGASHPA